MSRLLRGRHRRADLPAMLIALDEVLAAADGRIDPEVAGRAQAVAGRAGERLRLSGEHTVVALAGATGSGKSSLFNALAGADISPVGVRRPTTSRAHACVWGVEGAAPLVEWLGVPRRQTAWQHSDLDLAQQGDLEGLVLLDLPDHDSTATEHRLEVDRLVELVDLLVWVVDPQKYADAALHERYLRKLAGHDAVTLLVLNQTDTLNPFAAAACAEDLRRLIDEDGLTRAKLMTTSARTGAGLDALRAALADAVRRRRARNDRLVADVEAVADELAGEVAETTPAGIGRHRTRPARARPRRVRGRARHRRGGREVVAAAVRRSAGLAAHPLAAQAAARPAAPAAPELRSAPRGARDGPLVGARADTGSAGAGRDRRARRGRCGRCRAAAPMAGGGTTGRRPARPRTSATSWTSRSSAPTSGSTGHRCGGGWSAWSSGCSSWRRWSERAGSGCWPSAATCGCPSRRLPTGTASRCPRCCWSAECCSVWGSRRSAGSLARSSARRRRRRAEARLRAGIGEVADRLVIGTGGGRAGPARDRPDRAGARPRRLSERAAVHSTPPSRSRPQPALLAFRTRASHGAASRSAARTAVRRSGRLM